MKRKSEESSKSMGRVPFLEIELKYITVGRRRYGGRKEGEMVVLIIIVSRGTCFNVGI